MAEEKNNSNVGLGRFLTAQDGQRGDGTLYELALKEILEGKLGFECWIRYVYLPLYYQKIEIKAGRQFSNLY